MILKAGTYRLKEPLILGDSEVGIYQNINFTLDVDYEGYTAVATCDRFSIGGSADNFIKIEVNVLSLVPDLLASQGATYPLNFPIYTYNSDSTYSWSFGNSPMTITTDTDVSDAFGNFFIATTDYNEVNAKPLASITYNGETIAELNAGETAVIKCEEKRMITDIIIKINS